MDFLRPSRMKILRTRLYGDQEFSRFELELLHTPTFQRLYNLKQLGFTDRVFPDAVHSRFNHILGVSEMAGRMAQRIVTWLRDHPTITFEYADHAPGKGEQPKTATIEASALGDLLTSRVGVLRLVALLHDITHAAFGHTLEDEVSVFNEKHDDPARQIRFFNALIAQLLYSWSTEQQLHPFDAGVMEDLANLATSPDLKREHAWAEELGSHLDPQERKYLAQKLREVELALTVLLQIEFVHTKNAVEPAAQTLLAGDAASIIAPEVPALEFIPHRDMFMVDIVGNTVCADLLDYAKRDADNSGLKIQFDDRLLRYLCVISVGNGLSPTGLPCIRTGIQIFTDKMRNDVLSEMSGILKARYLIHERVLFHPTKCAAGAMLGTAVQLLGLRDLPPWMQVLGDQEFLRTLGTLASNLESLCSHIQPQIPLPKRARWRELVQALWSVDSPVQEMIVRIVEWILPHALQADHLNVDDLDVLHRRAHAARNLLARLNARRFPKLAYRLRTAHHTGGENDETIAAKYCNPKERYALERRIEDVCNLPMGSVVVHCPRRKTSMKVAEVLVVGRDLTRAAHLRNVTTVSQEGLEPYEREIKAIEDMYLSIWQLHAFVDLAHWDKQPLVEWAFERETKFPNDELLTEELAHEPRGTYHFLASDLRDEIPPKSLPEVVRRVDAEVTTRMRLSETEGHDLHTKLRQIIRSVLSTDTTDGRDQLDLPGFGPKE